MTEPKWLTCQGTKNQPWIWTAHSSDLQGNWLHCSSHLPNLTMSFQLSQQNPPLTLWQLNQQPWTGLNLKTIRCPPAVLTQVSLGTSYHDNEIWANTCLEIPFLFKLGLDSSVFYSSFMNSAFILAGVKCLTTAISTPQSVGEKNTLARGKRPMQRSLASLKDLLTCFSQAINVRP